MRYRVVMAQANERITTDLPKAAEALSRDVEQAANDGWRPQGGLVVTVTPSSRAVFLLQALIRDEAGDKKTPAS